MTHDQLTHDRAIEETGRPDIACLASTVISVINDKSDEGSQTIRPSMLRKMVSDCLSKTGHDAELLLSNLRDNRLVPEQLIDIYIPEAARTLGLMWAEDEITFAQVTIATARLQGLLTLLAIPWFTRISDPEDQISILVSLQVDDTHTLGPHVAIAQLRRLGASVRVLFGADSQTVVQMLSEDTYDLLMFSCSDTGALATIATMVRQIRYLTPDCPPVALGGLVLDLTDRVKERTGADLVTSDVRVAYKLCEKKRPKLKTVAK
ncbi:hypothetical protein P775_06100 [Puniceibacterium antarcticum]|uniref:B12-binding domain-containing protein n=1 Tax=Puniceibacterium antarcticum TaxID=1206336 RepID=A0A2G8RHN4_9RHOB|nr:hypothetical protein [Puniceibacterium antarcticum]PIL21116.1 hypothetical protein P775_06100 [Puniceibacterium antarcticum]